MESAKKMPLRTRFAPSPTGFLHIGSVRAALFNYLFAKKYEGKFVLRVEDTDKERSKPEFEADIIAGLKWLGLNWDEGPDADGEYGPYRQSERKGIYRKYLEQLISQGKAYYCFCSKEDLEAKKENQLSQGQQPKYDGKCANLSQTEIEANLKAGKSCVIRFKVPNEHIHFNDLIRGRVEFDCSLFGDMVIALDPDSPLYNFAVVVDDHEMQITHVIRGEDHIPNTPKQILIQRALDFPPFEYAHMPMILGPDKAKLSKRHNAEPVNFYYEQGYLPEAIINFMAFLGWNPGDEREIFSLEELIREFSMERCRKSGAIFNIQKLDWFNGIYIRNKTLDELTRLCAPYLEKSGLIKKISPDCFEIAATGKPTDFEYIKKAVFLYRERLIKLGEISELVDFMFLGELKYERELLKWKDMTEADVKKYLMTCEKILNTIPEDQWTFVNIEKNISAYLDDPANNISNRGYLLWPLRAALTGKKASCGPYEAADALGRERTLQRIKFAVGKYD